jgi:hypothetical protein
VAARISTRHGSRRAHLKRLAVVFALELRLQIVTELYTRAMSPTQFFDQFGGGSPARVTRSFRRLEEHGWLRYIRSAPAKGGRGKENFYRSPELAFFDAETWALVPYSVRVACSWNMLKETAPRLREAMEASISAQRTRKDLTCSSLLVDNAGWHRVIEVVDSTFVSLYEEQKDAQLRVECSGEKLFRADVLLIGFEAPMPGRRPAMDLIEARTEPLVPFWERVSPVLGDDLCMRIVRELSMREMSVTQFHREFGSDTGASRATIHARFRKLKNIGWLAKAKMETGGRRRGAKEIFYRATKPALSADSSWAAPPSSQIGPANQRAFKRLVAQMKEAMAAGTFDSREDRYVALSFLSLDRQGWQNVLTQLDSLHSFVLREQDLAKDRLAQSGEGPSKMIVSQGAFESPNGLVKAP